MTCMRYPFLLIVAGIFFTVSQANASLEDVTYPIAELGNCGNQEACFAYCDLSENYNACMAFAEAKKLIPTEEIQEYRQIQEAVAQGGPGGCTSEFECESYCGDLTHIDECLSFAQEHGLMSEEELAEAQQVQAALSAGYTLPGGCTDEVSCESYCSDATHMEECIAFGKAAGFITEEEAAEAEKFLTIVESGETPGGCQNQKECEAYCADGANAQQCLNFAVEAGFMTQEEADAALEMGLRSPGDFVGPGGCTDEQSCRAYCEQENNQEECQAFFGDIPGKDEGEGESEELVGPGGCVGEEACRAYCADSANQETCAAFFGESQREEEYESPQEYPEQEFPLQEHPLEYEGESEEGQYPEAYEYKENYQSMPDYQYEGGQDDEIYQYEEEGLYGQDEFESFDPGDVPLDFDQGVEDFGSYDEIYVKPPSAYNEPPSYNEQPSYNESPSFSEPSTSSNTGAPSADSNAPPVDSGPSPDSGGGESHSTANAGFVSSAKQLLRKVLRFLQI